MTQVSKIRAVAFKALVSSLCYFAGVSAVFALDSKAPLTWTSISDDLEVLEVGAPALFSSQMFFARTALKDYQVSVVVAQDFGRRVQSAKNVAENSKSVLAINGNFFDPDLKALGLVVNRGIQRNRIHKGGRVLTGIFELSGKGLNIFSRDGYEPLKALEAIQAGPRLLENGKPIAGLDAKDSITRRVGVCLDEKGRLVFFCSTSNLGGISLGDLQEVLLSSDVGCKNALNLDGGGSAQLYLKVNQKENRPQYEYFSPGMDEVPVFLTLKAR